jgi:hypothetical protein
MEVKEQLESEIQRELELLETVNKGSKEEQVLVGDICKLTEIIDRLNNTEWDFYDKQEKREIEKSRIQLDEKKSDLDWKRSIFEVVKIVLPSAITVFAYDRFQKRMLKFEETGRIVSSAGREFHLPKLPWR